LLESNCDHSYHSSMQRKLWCRKFCDKRLITVWYKENLHGSLRQFLHGFLHVCLHVFLLRVTPRLPTCKFKLPAVRAIAIRAHRRAAEIRVVECILCIGPTGPNRPLPYRGNILERNPAALIWRHCYANSLQLTTQLNFYFSECRIQTVLGCILWRLRYKFSKGHTQWSKSATRLIDVPALLSPVNL